MKSSLVLLLVFLAIAASSVKAYPNKQFLQNFGKFTFSFKGSLNSTLLLLSSGTELETRNSIFYKFKKIIARLKFGKEKLPKKVVLAKLDLSYLNE